MRYEVGDRLIIEEEVCTVKYVGAVCQWPGMAAYGVEWDNPNRGKNDGSLNGNCYFQALKFHSGSFIKASKLEKEACRGSTLDEAFIQKYLNPAEEINDIIPSSKLEAAKKIGYTRKLILDKSAINDEQPSEVGLNIIREHCAKVTHLDLSNNLLSNFNRTCRLLLEFGSLRSLDLSRNVFTNGWDNLGDFSCPQLESLRVVGSQLRIEQLEKILTCFPCIKSLDISWNYLSALGEKFVSFPLTLEELFVSGNSMTSLPPGISRLNLRNLNLSQNLLQSVDISLSANLRELDISYNRIQHWRILDLLDEALPELKALRVNKNPITEENNDDLFNFYATVARFRSIEILNGSLLSNEVRKEAELFFVSQVLNGKINYNKELARWLTLAKSYPTKKKKRSGSSSWLDCLIISVTVMDELTKKSINFKVLKDYSVRYLKTIIARKLSLGKSEFQIFFKPTPDVLEEMDSEFRPINYYGIVDNSTLYVKQKN